MSDPKDTVRYLGPSSEIFWKQDPALEVAEEGDQFVWSNEFNANKKRKYLVCGVNTFAQGYLKALAAGETLNWYEMVPAGHPVKLYFDIDGDPETCDLEAVTEELHLKCAALCGRTPEQTGLMVFDSTRADKASRHLIFLNIILHDVESAKAFVHDHLWPNISPATQDSIDKGVYHKNRNFRLYGSTKFGKPTRLKFLRIQPPPPKPFSEQRIFELSLISWLHPPLHKLKRLEFKFKDPVKRKQAKTATKKRKRGEVAGEHSAGRLKFMTDDYACEWVHGVTCLARGEPHPRRDLLKIYNLADKIQYFKCFDQKCADECGREARFGERPIPADRYDELVAMSRSFYDCPTNTTVTTPASSSSPVISMSSMIRGPPDARYCQRAVRVEGNDLSIFVFEDNSSVVFPYGEDKGYEAADPSELRPVHRKWLLDWVKLD